MFVITEVHSDRSQVVLVGPVHTRPDCSVLNAYPGKRTNIAQTELVELLPQCGICLESHAREHNAIVETVGVRPDAETVVTDAPSTDAPASETETSGDDPASSSGDRRRRR